MKRTKAFNPLAAYKVASEVKKVRLTTVTIESRGWDGTLSFVRRQVALLDDLEQYDCALCVAVRITAKGPDGRTATYSRGRL